ncbi:unnamed protein product [Thelazia callipaeda]|uniref:BOS complex subunit NCLN n=1 Tax=Thelazia callipaeda TaxID=103827 RepID=A0A0N5CR19_THECL|nr:unnamed protein product [Thelazia callipaeda]
MFDEFLDELRNPVMLVYMSMLLTWCVTSSTQLGDSVELEFKAYRLQQYDISGNPHGSRSWRVMYEAVSLDGNILRRCLIVNWHDLLGRDVQSLLNQVLGAVLIVVPDNLDTLTPSARSKLASLETNLMFLKTDAAVYVVQQEPRLQSIFAEVTAFSKRSPTAVQQLVNAISANIFQFSSLASISSNIITPKLTNVVGYLWSTDRNVPTVVLVAHYDSHAVVPALAIGADSNGSGVAALLELLSIFSRFYSSNTMKPKYNMIFLLTGGGKFNYQGSRHWLEEHIEKNNEMIIELVICLDSVGKRNGIMAHVSKIPIETSPVGRFFSLLKGTVPPNRTVEMVSKKINLNADMLAWEHEKFSMRRLSALTLSHYKSHTEPGRVSLLDTLAGVEIDVLEANVRAIGEALLAYVLNLPNTNCLREENIFTCSIMSSKDVNKQRLSYWLRQFGSKPRPSAGNNDAIVANLRDTVSRYTSGQVTVENFSLVDISLYGVLEDYLTAHRAKPAIFELLLATVIGTYLSALYFVAPLLQTTVEATLIKLKKL